MGLCKCPKRKVTNQFCYEHRVNVCQFCMVTNHSKCIVQSYLQWLQDSDYDPSCGICKGVLVSDECVRLVCFHVFHWECLTSYAKEFPETTAPAGYVCPTCREPIIPKYNDVSPVAEALRSKLEKEKWAKMGLHLENGDIIIGHENEGQDFGTSLEHSKNEKSNRNYETIVRIDEAQTSYRSSDNQGNNQRRVLQSLESIRNPVVEEDENKYHRRATTAIIARWFTRTLRSPGSRSSKFCAFGLTIFFLWLIFVLITGQSKSNTENIPKGPPAIDTLY